MASAESEEKRTIFCSADAHEKIAAIVRDGVECLQAIFDFDGTLTGIGAISSWHPVETYPKFSQAYLDETHRLYTKYHPIEIDPAVDRATKVRAMEEWWEQAHARMLEQNLTRQTFVEMVGAFASKIRFRDGTAELLHALHAHDVPVLVFSAGIGDVIELMLAAQGIMLPNMHVVSNFVRYDAAGRGVGWNAELIHVFNKHAVDMILFGDSPGDVGMSEGLGSDVQRVLRVGFLNIKVADRLDEFCRTFDVVLVLDDTFDFARDILAKMLPTK